MNLKVRKKLYNPAAAASPLFSDSCPRLTITVCRMSFNLLEAAHVLSHRVDDGWMTFFVTHSTVFVQLQARPT